MKKLFGLSATMLAMLMFCAQPVIAAWSISLPMAGGSYSTNSAISGSGFGDGTSPGTAEFAFGTYTTDPNNENIVLSFTAENTVTIAEVQSPAGGVWTWNTAIGSLAAPSGGWSVGRHGVRLTPASTGIPSYTLKHSVFP